MRPLIFAGTTEGRLLAERLAAMGGVKATLCVATAYGKEVLGELPACFPVLARRLDREQMAELMAEGGFDAVVDATHPYAVEVTANIGAAARAVGLPCLRLLRARTGAVDCQSVERVEQAVEVLAGTVGAVLLTTGSKDLEKYTALPDYSRRLYPRVLPTVEAIETCERLGFLGSHIIAMQGPYSTELNRAMLKQFEIKTLVTKDGGRAGGFSEKVEAARSLGVEVLVIGRPTEETGLTLEQVMDELISREREGTT